MPTLPKNELRAETVVKIGELISIKEREIQLLKELRFGLQVDAALAEIGYKREKGMSLIFKDITRTGQPPAQDRRRVVGIRLPNGVEVYFGKQPGKEIIKDYDKISGKD